MIPRSPYMAVLCVGLAGTLHAAIAVLPMAEPERIAIQGGGGASISTLGDSFADMAEGASVPQPKAATLVEPTKTPAPRPQATQTGMPTRALTPKAAEPVEPQIAHAPRPEMPTTAPAPVPVTSPTPQGRILAALTPLQESAAPAPESSVRPRARPDRPKPKRQVTSAPKPAGNADRSARAGDASGREKAQQQQAGSSDSVHMSAGNAAAANYPGQIIRRIQRTRRERVNLRGSAQVSFTIAANGALAAVSIVRSSGSARLDQVALQQIRRAAPFPPPPAGARRNFILRIDGT